MFEKISDSLTLFAGLVVFVVIGYFFFTLFTAKSPTDVMREEIQKKEYKPIFEN